MSAPLAYFVTWTGYGTRLPGDERGSVDREHNRPGTPILPPNPRKEELASLTMTGPAFVMNDAAREVVDAAIRRHCEIRGWRLLALNVRTTHVHVVVAYTGLSPEDTMEQFKAWCTRKLREGGLVGKSQKAWTRHGSTPWINHGIGLTEAIDYVLNRQ